MARDLPASLFALSIACHGGAKLQAAPSPSDELAVIHSPQQAPLTEPLRLTLPFGSARAVLGGTATLLASASDHAGPALHETSSGVIEFSRDGKTEKVRFQANQAFEAWGYKMGVFGASGSYELGVFPPGVAFEP